jgi:hypothetical protein
MATKKAVKTPAKTATITWTRLPKGAEAVKASGAKSPQLAKLLRNARMNPRDPCFGGNTCIV